MVLVARRGKPYNLKEFDAVNVGKRCVADIDISGKMHRVSVAADHIGKKPFGHPAKRSGLLYAEFEFESFDSMMQNSYFM